MSALPPFIPPSGLTKLLVADPVSATSGPIEATASPTMVGDVPVAALVEEQSTTKAHLFPRMTTAQVNAISPAVDGMAAYDTTLSSLRFLQGGNWNVNFSLVAVVVPHAAILDMYNTPFQIIAAPGEGLITFVTQAYCSLIHAGAAFTNGGKTFLQYGNGAPNFDNAAAGAVEVASMTSGASRIFGMASAIFLDPTGISLDGTSFNQPIFLTNLDEVFQAGGTSSLVVNVLYTVIKPLD